MKVLKGTTWMFKSSISLGDKPISVPLSVTIRIFFLLCNHLFSLAHARLIRIKWFLLITDVYTCFFVAGFSTGIFYLGLRQFRWLGVWCGGVAKPPHPRSLFDCVTSIIVNYTSNQAAVSHKFKNRLTKRFLAYRQTCKETVKSMKIVYYAPLCVSKDGDQAI